MFEQLWELKTVKELWINAATNQAILKSIAASNVKEIDILTVYVYSVNQMIVYRMTQTT